MFPSLSKTIKYGDLSETKSFFPTPPVLDAHLGLLLKYSTKLPSSWNTRVNWLASPLPQFDLEAQTGPVAL